LGNTPTKYNFRRTGNGACETEILAYLDFYYVVYITGVAMKNILIFGPSRAGKTTLAKRLQIEFGFNIVNWDILIHAFARAFPQLEINFDGDGEKTDKNITPFVAYYLCELARHSNYNKTGSKFVADMSCYVFDTLFSLMEWRLSDMDDDLNLHEEFEFIYLGSSRTGEELFSDVKRYDTNDDWTYYSSDDELRSWCEAQTGVDPWIDAKMNELKFLRYDVAQGRKQVFDRIVSDLRMVLLK
jgi:hypothetical protein